MVVASLAPSCSSSADAIFKTQIVRSFLHKRGDQSSGEPDVFMKPMHPSQRPSSRDPRTCQPSLQPFQSTEAEELIARRRRGEDNRREAAPGAAYLGQGPAWRRSLNRQRPRPASSGPPSSPIMEGGGVVDEHTAMGLGSPDPHAMMTPSSSSSCTAFGAFTRERRRRPVHATSVDDSPSNFSFSEEPEDARVHLPAHRIGDAVPEGSSMGSRSSGRARQSATRHLPASRSLKTSELTRSSPALILRIKKMPLHEVHESGSPGRWSPEARRGPLWSPSSSLCR
mmetsp:Transcript_52600/g.118480  ORF Transcript_52600/g.118480 Transcript_52600/m.118480 type:complete len:283 (-) Transcript_52600:75-923(-)